MLAPIAVPAESTESAQSVPGALAAEQVLLDKATGAVRIRPDAATGGKGLVRVERGGDLLPEAPAVLTPTAKTSAFLQEHGAVFGIDDAARELSAIGTETDQLGHSRVSYQQIYQGVPVFGAVLRGHIDAEGKLSAVNGKFISEIAVNVVPRIDAVRAYSVAATAVQSQQPPLRESVDLTAKSATLMVYRTNLTRGLPGENYLVYQVEVTNDTTVREFVYVDAHTGKIVDQITGIQTLKNRRVYESVFMPDSPNAPPPAWKEGDPRPALDPAHEDEISGAGYSYNFFFNLSNGTFRSWDGSDARMYTVNNDPTIVCPNANWNGTSTNYCSGTSADDVVVHEWTHAYTQETSNLIYQWQSGALNESYSDIFGETVDLINNREGVEGTAATGNNGPRSQDDSVCSEFTSETPTGDDSIRWLIGEDAFAFSPLPPIGDAAIRDMWHPDCAGGVVFRGDPGHVGEGSNYSCSSGDAGGVHTNSGVPNRAYALLVDGDTVTLKDNGTPFANPVTVNGIGLTKAASIYWRANSVYNGPASNFNDNADSLEMACADLVGVNLPKLVTNSELPPINPLTMGNNDKVDPRRQLSGQRITVQDCLQVTAAIAAVQMRTDVQEQCNFQPMLNPAPAPRCGSEGVNSFFTQNWEGGQPGNWTTGEMGVSKPNLDTRPWFLRSGDLPPNLNGSAHPGKAMYQENRRDLGNCSTDDESGRLWLESPVITVDADDPSQLLFEHYVSTETNYDGGNVLISINGLGFEDANGNQNVIPSEAFVYNPYPGRLFTVADQNTNPKQGQEAFHGSNPGTVFGSWGESQIDLAKAGVSPGDTVQFRWELGQDGCNGADGWYLDDVELFTCGAGGTPSDVMCRGKKATIVGTPGNDVINGTAGADVIHGLEGADQINGLGGADMICGGSGGDTIRGADGADSLIGGFGIDTLYGGAGNDKLFGDEGDDRLFGEADNDHLDGRAGTDQCDGGTGGGDTAANCEQSSNIP